MPRNYIHDVVPCSTVVSLQPIAGPSEEENPARVLAWIILVGQLVIRNGFLSRSLPIVVEGPWPG